MYAKNSQRRSSDNSSRTKPKIFGSAELTTASLQNRAIFEAVLRRTTDIVPDDCGFIGAVCPQAFLILCWVPGYLAFRVGASRGACGAVLHDKNIPIFPTAGQCWVHPAYSPPDPTKSSRLHVNPVSGCALAKPISDAFSARIEEMADVSWVSVRARVTARFRGRLGIRVATMTRNRIGIAATPK